MLDSLEVDRWPIVSEMEESGSEPKASRRRFVVGAATVALVIGAVLWTMSAVAGGDDQLNDADVCDTTEYEGCPARWEYLWADED